MTEQELHKLKFPIGKFIIPKEVTPELKASWIGILKNLPTQLEEILEGTTEEQLAYAYRPEGWSICQVVHHLADSHMNAFIRTKMALTEVSPVVKAYSERKFALLSDGVNMDISPSLSILRGIHARYVIVLESMSEADFAKTYIHPESKYTYRMDVVLALYAWHSMHHLGHIRQALASKGTYNSLENGNHS